MRHCLVLSMFYLSGALLAVALFCSVSLAIFGIFVKELLLGLVGYDFSVCDATLGMIVKILFKSAVWKNAIDCEIKFRGDATHSFQMELRGATHFFQMD